MAEGQGSSESLGWDGGGVHYKGKVGALRAQGPPCATRGQGGTGEAVLRDVTVEARAGPHPPPVPRDLNPTPPRGYSPAHRTEKGLLCRWFQKKPG